MVSYDSPSSSSSSSSSSSVQWANWVPECLQPAMAIATDMSSYHHHQPHHFSEEEEEQDDDNFSAEDEYLETSALDAEDDEDENSNNGQEEHTEEDMDLFRSYGFVVGQQPQDQPLHQRHHRQSHAHSHHLPLQSNQFARSLACLSCKEIYTPRQAGTCRECYDEASDAKEALRKEIEELNARITFLKTWAPEAMEEGCADIVLECSDGSKIRAHRSVLISRSPVFKAMLESRMEESRTNTIKISDFAHEVLVLFVHYMYSAEIYPESFDMCASDLLALADKYNVKHLKSVCERHMISKLGSENALSNFEFASLHGAKALKQAALSTIIANIHELVGSTEYRELVNRDARLVVEVFESYMGKSKTQ